jgi:uncharacterized membrane protein YedE/YeeE
MTMLYGLLVGLVMGVLIQRVRASSPATIVQNLRLENLGIIKFMALTIAVSATLSYALGPWLPMHFAIKPTHLGVLIGGLIFGVGFAVAGYCPGTCVVGAGEGRKDAMVTILGGLAGALVFTLAFPTLDRLFIQTLNMGSVTLADLAAAPALWIALALSAVLIAVVSFLPTRPGRSPSSGA